MRPSLDRVFMAMALALSRRALCNKRQVGCLLLSEHGILVGSGYNGRARGLPNCHYTDVCQGACEGLHAEINALLSARGQDVATCIVSVAPCRHCVKALMNTQCHRIITPLEQPLDEDQQSAAKLWLDAGRIYETISI